MKNQKSLNDKIHSLQTRLLFEVSENGVTLSDRFVAFTAHASENPVDTLHALAKSSHPSLPDCAEEWIKASAKRIAWYIGE